MQESFHNTWEKVLCVFPVESRNCSGWKTSKIVVSNCDWISRELEHPSEISWNLLFLCFPNISKGPGPAVREGAVVPPTYKWFLLTVASSSSFHVFFPPIHKGGLQGSSSFHHGGFPSNITRKFSSARSGCCSGISSSCICVPPGRGAVSDCTILL